MKRQPKITSFEMAGSRKEHKDDYSPPMTFGEHIEEFRKRLIYILLGLAISIIICLVSGPKIVAYLRTPYMSIISSEGLDLHLQSLAASDGFITYVQVSILAGLFIAAPWTFYQLWLFVAAGLHPAEKQLVKFAAPTSARLFVSGGFFLLRLLPHLHYGSL